MSAAEPDVIARAVSVLALLVAVASLYLSWRSFRRSGARVSVSVEKQLHYAVLFVNEPIFDNVLTVRARNAGMAPVQITNLFYEVDGRNGFVTLNPSGPALPHVLAGLHEAVWIPSLSTVAEGARLDDSGTVRVRAGVVLGDGREVRSKWIAITRDDLDNA